MHGFLHANLINVFDFYLSAMMVLSIYRRRAVYWNGLQLVLTSLKRRRLLNQLGHHRDALLTRDLLRPFFLAMVLLLIQILCSRVIFPQATVSIAGLSAEWWKLALLILAFLPMLSVDLYFLIRVGQFDRGETEKYLDSAEHWLGWRGSAVRVLTLGIVNPRTIVRSEVRKSLYELGRTIGWVMWWVSVQSSCRVVFGLAIWLLWAMG
jgi:hypothetical protein